MKLSHQFRFDNSVKGFALDFIQIVGIGSGNTGAIPAQEANNRFLMLILELFTQFHFFHKGVPFGIEFPDILF